MTWWDYVVRIAGGEEQAAIARKVGVGQSMVSRWRTSTPRPENVAAFARSYQRPVLEAFVAAGFLTPEDAGERPSAAPSPTSLSDDELVGEVLRRLRSVDMTRATTRDAYTLAARTVKIEVSPEAVKQDAAGEENQDHGGWE